MDSKAGFHCIPRTFVLESRVQAELPDFLIWSQKPWSPGLGALPVTAWFTVLELGLRTWNSGKGLPGFIALGAFTGIGTSPTASQQYGYFVNLGQKTQNHTKCICLGLKTNYKKIRKERNRNKGCIDRDFRD